MSLQRRRNAFLSLALATMTVLLALPSAQARWYQDRAYAAPAWHRGWARPYYAPAVAPAPYYGYPGYRPGISTGTAILGAAAIGAAGLGLGAWLASTHAH